MTAEQEELCIDCDQRLEDEEYPRCTECQLIEDGVLAPCPKCDDVVDADQLVSHPDDDRCDGCRDRDLLVAEDRSDYYARVR